MSSPANWGSTLFFCLTLGLFVSTEVGAEEEVLTSTDEFLSAAFDGAPAETKTIWITPDLREKLEAVSGRAFPGARFRYWNSGDTNAWILERIGKERLITAGFVTEKGELVGASLLVYREARGGEVRHQFFLSQFQGASLTPSNQLSRHIDGISGATLSVRSMIHMAEMALILDAHLRSQDR